MRSGRSRAARLRDDRQPGPALAASVALGLAIFPRAYRAK
jgi:hypothetical protein